MAINKDITEAQLKEIKQALYALLKTVHTPSTAEQLANDYTYAVFRGLFSIEGMYTWICNRAKRSTKGFA